MGRRTTAAAVATVLVALLLPQAPLGATSPSVSYSASGCQELAVLAPTDAFSPGDVLVVIVYECERAVFGDHVVAPFVVSEIGVVRAGSSWSLLRWVGNSRRVASRLHGLGLPASFSPKIDFAGLDGGPLGDVSAHVPVEDATYRLRGSAIASALPASDSSADGAAWVFDGKRGLAELRYRWDQQEPVPGQADVLVDATDDPPLQRWLGGRTQTRAQGPYNLGGWTGTGRLLDTEP